jgi:hypothetical protein
MAIMAKDSGGGNFPIPEAGLHNAVCAKMFDLGIQEGYEGKPRHEVVIFWELEEKITEGEYQGKPFLIYQSYTLSLNEKANLRKDLESWRGKTFTEEEAKGFDIEKLLNIPCTLNIVHKTTSNGTRARISGVMPKQKSAEALIPTLEKDWMPKWVEEKLGGRATEKSAETSDEFDDDIPF